MSIWAQCARWWRFLLCIPSREFLQPAVFWELLLEPGSVLCPLKWKKQRYNHAALSASTTFRNPCSDCLSNIRSFHSSRTPHLLLSFLWKLLEMPPQWKHEVSCIKAWTSADQTNWSHVETVIDELLLPCLAPALTQELHSHSQKKFSKVTHPFEFLSIHGSARGLISVKHETSFSRPLMSSHLSLWWPASLPFLSDGDPQILYIYYIRYIIFTDIYIYLLMP